MYEFDDMELVEYVSRIRSIGHDGVYIGRRHVGGNQFYLRPLPFHLLPEVIQGIGSLAVANIYYVTRVKVYDNSLIDMSFTDSELVDANALYLLDAYVGVFLFEVAFVYVLHHVPSNPKVECHVLYRHPQTQQVKYIAGETESVADASMSERDVCLIHLLAVLALEALNGQREICMLAAYRQVVDVTVLLAVFDDIFTVTMRTSALFRGI